jgi:uncharacterized protein DUF3892
MSIRITCINKSGGYQENPHEAIGRLGWTNEQTGERSFSTCEQMWKFIHDEGGIAYVRDTHGNMAYVRARTNSRGTKYVQTEKDNIPTANLLLLSECS